MSMASRLLPALLWLACAWPSLAEEPIAGPECVGDVCVLNVIATKLISPPCVGYSVLVAYSKSSGATLIQCSKFASEQENRSFIYDRRDARRKPFEFKGGRFIRSEYLAKAEEDGIPDKFGPVALCVARNRETLTGVKLLIAEKLPNRSEANPYCYRINYVIA